MAIIIETQDWDLNNLRLNTYPDEFISEKEKQKDSYSKSRMDYFANIAYHQYAMHKETIGNNYDLVKGILHKNDFYDDPVTKSFVDTLLVNNELPPDVKHYPILNPPINTLVGELANRPDLSRIRAMDDDSKSERLNAMTDIVQQYIIQEAQNKILAKHAAESGEPLSPEDLQSLTMEEVQENLISYTSLAEKWANRILPSCKVEFNMKEISEDCFRDLLISSSEYFHVYENNSKTGFDVANLNPKNEWHIHLSNKKYTSDPTGTGKGTPAAGIVSVMELSEIIELFNLTKEEIDHLREDGLESQFSVPSSFSRKGTGVNTIQYPQVSRLKDLERQILESQLSEENNDDISNVLGLSSSINAFGNKFVVVQAYWISKKKIANVTYLDEEGNIQTTMVDESYKKIPNQIDIQWGYINQWMKGYKIGAYVYNTEPLKILDYCPIIGVVHEGKNTKAKSLVDLMKPLQIIYNICYNQIFRLLEKEWGVFIEYPLRKLVTSKDGDGQDVMETTEEEARVKGIIYTDDSMENTKIATTNTSVTKVHDASRGNEIVSRMNLAAQMKAECWELVGITRQRLGSTSGSTETATATQAGLSQSYTQTEHLFTQHQYLLNQVYQAIIDAAQYITINKPESTTTYIANTGEDAFIKVTGNDLKMRDLKVFVTSRPEDVKINQKFEELIGAYIQNGGDLYDASVAYETSSLREKQALLLKLKKQKEEFQKQEQQNQQAQLQQQQAQFEQTMQQQAQEKQYEIENENYQKELDRLHENEIEYIKLQAKIDNATDTDGDGVPDAIEISRLGMDISTNNRNFQTSLLELQSKNDAERNKIFVAKEKLQVEREKMRNDLKMAKLKPKPKPAKKK